MKLYDVWMINNNDFCTEVHLLPPIPVSLGQSKIHLNNFTVHRSHIEMYNHSHGKSRVTY